MWFSNWLAGVPSIVQCPVLCTRGAISFTSSSGHHLEISRCEFYDNTGTANYNGGAIKLAYNYGNVVVSNSVFIGNTAETVLNRLDCSVLTVKPKGFVSPVTLAEGAQE